LGEVLNQVPLHGRHWSSRFQLQTTKLRYASCGDLDVCRKHIIIIFLLDIT